MKAYALGVPKIQKSSSKDIKITYKQGKYVAEIFQLQNPFFAAYFGEGEEKNDSFFFLIC